jgi:hypothetical protein
MKYPTLLATSAYRNTFLALIMGLGCTSASIAQDGAPTEPVSRSSNADGRSNQRTERIQFEDAGSRVDELRVGGQTKSITVQPKVGDVPAYEVQPSDGVRNLPGSRNGSETNTGPRVWNVMKF